MQNAPLRTFIKLPFVIKIFVLSIFEWPFYTGFTVLPFSASKLAFLLSQSLPLTITLPYNIFYIVLHPIFFVLSADIWKQFDPDQVRHWSGYKLFDTLMVLLKEFFEKVNFEKKINKWQKSWKKFINKQRLQLIFHWTENRSSWGFIEEVLSKIQGLLHIVCIKKIYTLYFQFLKF